MHIEAFRDLCLSLPGATENFPFGEQTLVFKVGGKIFALTNIDQFESINLKCDPERAVELREQFEEIRPGYHMNKKHWNTVVTDGDVPDTLLREMILESYELVKASLPAKVREAL